MKRGNPDIKVDLPKMVEYYENKLGTENHRTKPHYPQREEVDDSTMVSPEEIETAIKSIKLDTSAGPDGILARTIKTVDCKQILALMANIMLKFKYVPNCLKNGRLILIPKNGDPNDPRNFRPIIIFSVIRRIIEKCLQSELKFHVEISEQQTGFQPGPGTHINASILNGCLKDAKKHGKEICIIFLDVTKAVDSIGHKHLINVLRSGKIPNSLASTVIELIKGNSVQIESGPNKSKPIYIKNGVAQGAPLSPLIFNLGIDHIIREMNEMTVKTAYGLEIDGGDTPVTLLAFADDLAVVGKDVEAARSILSMIEDMTKEIGLSINPSKSQAIVIKQGKLVEETIEASDGLIHSINGEGKIKYLGTSIRDEIVLDKPAVITNLTHQLNNLAQSEILQPDQKLNILNQYVWPTLVYPLQCAPPSKNTHNILRGRR